MNNEYCIQITKPKGVAWLSKWEITLVYEFHVSILDIRTGTIQQICKTADKVDRMEKSGDYFLISRSGGKFLIHRGEERRISDVGSQYFTISGNHVVVLSNCQVKLYNCKTLLTTPLLRRGVGVLRSVAPEYITNTYEIDPLLPVHHVFAGNGHIDLISSHGVGMISIDGSRISYSYKNLGVFTGIYHQGSAFYLNASNLVEHDVNELCSKTQIHEIRESDVVYFGNDAFRFNYIRTDKIEISSRDFSRKVHDKRRNIQIETSEIYGQYKISCGKLVLNLSSFSLYNDMLVFYIKDLRLFNYKCDLFSMFWKYEKPELLKLRFEVAMQLRRILPCPIVKLIISECK